MGVYAILYGVLLGVCVGTWWKAGQMEDAGSNTTSVVWSGLGAMLFLVTWLFLGWGWLGILAAQFGLALGIAVLRAGKLLYETRSKAASPRRPA